MYAVSCRWGGDKVEVGLLYVMRAAVAVVIIQTKKLNEINLEETEKKSKRDSYVDASESSMCCIIPVSQLF